MQWSFLGHAYGFGQPHDGLQESARYARQHLAQYLSIANDIGDIHYVPIQQTQSRPTSFHHLTTEQLLCYIQSYHLALSAYNRSSFCVNWGGDHSISIATIAAFKQRFPNGKVIYIDAHADANTSTSSPSGNIHGQHLSVLYGLEKMKAYPQFESRLHYDDIFYIGARDLDPFEVSLHQDMNIQEITISDLRQNLDQCLQKLLHFCGQTPVHVSFDIDSVDPLYAKATGLHVKDGLLPFALTQIANLLSEKTHVKSLDVVEINPLLASTEETKKTYTIAENFLKPFIFKTRRIHDSRYEGVRDISSAAPVSRGV